MTLFVPVSPGPMQKCEGCGEEWDQLRLLTSQVAASRGGIGVEEGKICPRCAGLDWPGAFMEEHP